MFCVCILYIGASVGFILVGTTLVGFETRLACCVDVGSCPFGDGANVSFDEVGFARVGFSNEELPIFTSDEDGCDTAVGRNILGVESSIDSVMVNTVKTGFDFPGYTTSITTEANCDGWGTLQTPARTYKKNDPTAITNCLRIRSKNTNTTSVGPISFSNVSHIYEWMTEGSINASVSSDTNDTPTSVGYSQAGATGSVSSELDAENVLKMTISSNPAHTQTFLGYSLPVHGNVQVSLMNTLGSEVKMLHNGQSPAGTNSVRIDPTTLANGTYFIRVVTDGYSATRKLIITK